MINKFNFYNIEVYKETLKNGLTVILSSDKTKTDVYATFTTKFGGAVNTFKYENKYITVPNGIAHFLEHKMFEMEDGVDPFTFYNKTGSYNNAYTNYYNTTYIFSSNKSFKKNLNYLLDFVQSPYFTDENVEKEKGIITEEIKMYDDMPDNILFEKSMYNLFINNPVRYSVSGTVEDVLSITKEDLYKCYNTFYNPKNMILIITGNFSIDKAIEIIKDNQNNKKITDNEIKIKEIKEPDEVYKEYEKIKYQVEIPYVSYSVKIPIKDFKINNKKLNYYLSIIFDVLFDETSLFYENISRENLINSSLDIDNFNTKDHKIFTLSFKSDKYKEILGMIDKTLDSISIEKNELERKKKVLISNLLYAFDDTTLTNKLLLSNMITYDDLCLNTYDLIKDLNKEELDKIIKKIKFNKSILILEK